MPNWLILSAFTAGFALLVGATAYQGAVIVAADIFAADGFTAKRIVNEHYRGQ